VTRNQLNWFHCGHCNDLFRSPPGESEDRVCPKCGLDPSLGLAPSPAVKANRTKGPALGGSGQSAVQSNRELGSRRENASHYFMMKLIGGWLLFLVAIVVVSKLLWPSQSGKAPFVSMNSPKVEISAPDVALLEGTQATLSLNISGFIAARTPEERNQFVMNPIDTVARMARFYELNPQVTFAPESLSLVNTGVLKLPAGRAIESNWMSKDGQLIDTVFVEQDKEWLLDWDHFARYSTYPWALFLAGSGKPEGEFRLLARERLAEERKDADTISIALYAPRFGAPDEAGFQSPEFLVKRDSPSGRLLDAAFKMEKSGKRVFGLNTPDPDPEGFIRVRVKVRRTDSDAGRRFELLEVVACHWYSVDVPGMEIPEAPAEK
jgi:hypothetical protein